MFARVGVLMLVLGLGVNAAMSADREGARANGATYVDPAFLYDRSSTELFVGARPAENDVIICLSGLPGEDQGVRPDPSSALQRT
jgi:hypothetical protein